MVRLPEITLQPVFHKKEHQIKIGFKYNDVLINVLRPIPEARWSKTLKSWYIKNTSDHIKLLHRSFKDLAKVNADAILDTSLPMHQHPAKRLRNLTDANKSVLNNFYKFLKGKRYSTSTIQVYTQLVADFVEYYNHKPLDQLTNRDVELFIETVYIKRKYSISTQRQFISALKLFVVFNPELLINNLVLERPSKSKYLPNVLSQEDVLKIIKFTKNLKHKTIITLLYSCGLRISELINLELTSIDLNRKQLHVKSSKGRKDRIVTIAESFIPLVSNYYSLYKPSFYLFEGVNQGKYSEQSIRQFLKRSCEKANIKKNVTPHTLRHSYATHMLENGVDIRYIQALLGHARPETTMIYTHVQRKDLMAISNPLDVAIKRLKEAAKNNQNVVLSRK